MDTYYTIEEKYLQAVAEVQYGETPKGLQLLNEILAADPLYARAHYQLGKIYYYQIKEYQTAGYHFKTCLELDPAFPDNYFHYLSLLVFLNLETTVGKIAVKALATPGVCACCIHNLLGLFHEKNKKWALALQAYKNGFMEVTTKAEFTAFEESIERVKLKMQKSQTYNYELSG